MTIYHTYIANRSALLLKFTTLIGLIDFITIFIHFINIFTFIWTLFITLASLTFRDKWLHLWLTKILWSHWYTLNFILRLVLAGSMACHIFMFNLLFNLINLVFINLFTNRTYRLGRIWCLLLICFNFLFDIYALFNVKVLFRIIS